MKLDDLDEKADSQLRSLDQRFIAAAAPRVAHAVDRATHAKEAAAQLVRDIDLRDLRALDDKYARRGPLAFFREVPQLLAVVAGIVFMIGTLSIAYEKEPVQQGSDETVSTTTGGSTTGTPGGGVLALGPQVGKQTTAYLTYAANSLTDAAKEHPDDQRLAMVSLSAYYRPELADSIMSGYVVKRAWVHVSAAGKLAPPMIVVVDDDLGASLKDFYRRQAPVQAVAASKYQELADTTTGDPANKAFYQQFATLSRKQSQAFTSDCSCAYAFVVEATPTQLLSLRSRPGIRAVEVAGANATIGNLDITTLLPEVKGVVPNPVEAADPPS